MSIFLSHASADKKRFANQIAEKIGQEAIYDQNDFESGQRNWDEIEYHIKSCDVFAVLISSISLDRPWVQREIAYIKELLNSGIEKRVVPVIIDSNVEYSDSRIPNWLSTDYNLRYLGGPNAVVRMLNQANLEEKIKKANAKQAHDIFIGRQEQIKQFESIHLRFDPIKPYSLFVTGLPSIGRRSVVRKALISMRLIREYHQFPVIKLDKESNLQDFLLTINDAFEGGVTGLENIELSDDSAVHKKCVEILRREMNRKVRIILIDNGAIIKERGEITSWYSKIVMELSSSNFTQIYVVSNKKPRLSGYESIESINLSELTAEERNLLLAQLIEINDISIDASDYKIIAQNLHGLPEEAYFAAHYIRINGSKQLVNNINVLVEFNRSRAATAISSLGITADEINFLRMMSEFEMISISTLNSITKQNQASKIEKFKSIHFCEAIGWDSEYVRVNDSIKDYLLRSVSLTERNAIDLNEFANSLSENLDDAANDELPAYNFAVRSLIKQGKELRVYGFNG